MAIQDIPVFREARRGQVLRSDDWNGMQRELRQGIRGHRHTRLASAPPNDSATSDLALQISTDEIADGAVTAAKLSPDVLGGLGGGGGAPRSLTALELTPQSGSPSTGAVSLAPRATQGVTHGLGNVHVGVMLGVHQTVSGLRGEFTIYGGATSVIAAVPRIPDGTFTLVSSTDETTGVHWWAWPAPESNDLNAVEAPPPPPAPRRRARRTSKT